MSGLVFLQEAARSHQLAPTELPREVPSQVAPQEEEEERRRLLRHVTRASRAVRDER